MHISKIWEMKSLQNPFEQAVVIIYRNFWIHCMKGMKIG